MSSPRIIEVSHGTPEYTAMVELRRRWLREPLGLEFTEEELAGEQDAHHLACYIGDNLVGCAVLYPWEGHVMRLRQLIVRPDFERQGIGAALVQDCELLAARLGAMQVVLFARDTAVGFYERLDYQACGEPFVEIGILHQRMEKRLSFEDSTAG